MTAALTSKTPRRKIAPEKTSIKGDNDNEEDMNNLGNASDNVVETPSKISILNRT